MVFLFYGPNTYMALQKLRELRQAYVAKTGGDYGIERVDGAMVTLDDLLANLTAAPMFATSRLVQIDSLSANKSASDQVERLVTTVPETTVAVFMEPEVDQRTSYYKTMTKLAKAVRFDKPSPAQLASWIRKKAAEYGAIIEPAALNRLVESCGDDQWRLEQELLKLANYQADISLEAVRLLVPTTPSQTIFELVEAVAAGNLKQALGVYQGLLRDRTNEIYILTMIIWQLRNLLLAKTAGNRTPAELAKAAGMSPYVATKALQRQRSFSEATLKQAFFEAVDTDHAVKTGGGAPEVLVEQLIYRLASLPHQ